MNVRTMIHRLIPALFAVSVALVSGCGGGGGGGGGTPPVASTAVKGTASKGIIYPGTVKLYAVDANGVKGSAPLKTVSTNSDGTYTADLGSYSGALIVEVSGTYTDEAWKQPVTIDPATPLHAVVDAVNNTTTNNRPIAVTPLTELAYSMMTSFTTAQISAVNKQVSDLFKVDDIIAVEPVAPASAAMGASGVTVSQQAYTLVLAAISQMAMDANANGSATSASFSQIAALLNSFKQDITSPDACLLTKNITAFSAALATIESEPELSGFTEAGYKLADVGSISAKLTLRVTNVPTGVQLGSLKVTLSLPTGVSIRTGTSGQVVPGLITPAGAAAGGTALVTGYYQAASNSLVISLVSTAGFGAGDCATVTFDVTNGVTLTAASVPVVLNEAKDAGPTYGPVTGVTVGLQ